MIFAVELMMPEVSARTFLPVALATGTATFIGRIFLRPQSRIQCPALRDISARPSDLYLLAAYAVLGGLSGLAATAFIRGLHWTEEQFERVANPYLRHAIGMTMSGR